MYIEKINIHIKKLHHHYTHTLLKNKTKEHKKCFTISTEKLFRSQKHTHQFAFGFRTVAEHFLDPC